MDRLIFHIDVNNAFLSWSAVDMLKNGFKKDIREEVSVIGGDEGARHGIVLAKSNPAKKYGIKTAETLYSARRKYKDLKVYKPNHKIYKQFSDQLYEYFTNFSPKIERYSIDECFIDMSGMNYFIKDPIEFADNMRKYIKENFGYTVNVGIGNNKLCAKVASDFEKPDKTHTLFNDEIENKLWPLAVGDLFMVGKKTETKLKHMNINTVFELAHTPVEILTKTFKSYGIILHEFANGIDDSEVVDVKQELKGIGNSLTYPIDIESYDDIKQKLIELSSMVGTRLRNEKKYAYTETLYVKYSDFTTLTHQKKLKNPISNDDEILKYALELLKDIEIKPIRSMGIRLNNLTLEKQEQLSIFDNDIKRSIKNDELQITLDKLKKKYGDNIVKKASNK